jgi:[ribosomal protein S5]-alanine N-acetyltransferase
MSDSRLTYIRGDGIILRPLTEKDLDGSWYGWFNDPEVTWYQNKGIFPNTLEKQTVFYQHLQNDSSQVTLAIESEGVHIGNVTLKDIDWVHRTAELGIVIGEKAFWGKGLGAQAWWLITRYGILTLNLNKIMARVFSGNERSLKSALRSGYVVEGEQAEQFYRHGQYYSAILVGITAARWRACFGTDESRAFGESELKVAP